MRDYTMTVRRLLADDPVGLARQRRFFRRINARARVLGGWAWKSTDVDWRVTLPAGVPCSLPVMASLACTRAPRAADPGPDTG